MGLAGRRLGHARRRRQDRRRLRSDGRAVGLAGLDPSERRLDLPEGFAEALVAVCRGEGETGLAGLLAGWCLDDRGRAYLIAPQDARTGEAAAVARLALVLAELGLARPLLLRRPRQLPTWWREPREEQLAPHTHLRVYRLRRRLLPLLLLAALRRRLADGPRPSPRLLPRQPAAERVL